MNRYFSAQVTFETEIEKFFYAYGHGYCFYSLWQISFLQFQDGAMQSHVIQKFY